MEIKNKIIVKCKNCKEEFHSTIRYKGRHFKHCNNCLKIYKKNKFFTISIVHNKTGYKPFKKYKI